MGLAQEGALDRDEAPPARGEWDGHSCKEQGSLWARVTEGSVATQPYPHPRPWLAAG